MSFDVLVVSILLKLTIILNHSFMNNNEKATFGAGCFWCVEAVFQEVEGVKDVVSGYSGGDIKNPGYREVCTGRTGHAEVVQVTFDPEAVSYKQLLLIFFRTHDPTTMNRQGNDIGTQYRSVIFYHDEEQRKMAQDVKQEMNESGKWKNPVITEISLFKGFYRAEEYHQDYFKKNKDQPYCRIMIAPKLEKFHDIFDK